MAPGMAAWGADDMLVLRRRSVMLGVLPVAHPSLLALSRMADAGRTRHKIFGRLPRPAGSRSISRPSDRSTESASGLGLLGSRSLRQEFGGIRYARFHDANNQDWSHCRLQAAPWQPHQLISGRAPAARTKILHTRGSSAPRWMGLISRTADKANPASSVTHPSRLWPGSVGQTQSNG
jgi:hypothetical protein